MKIYIVVYSIKDNTSKVKIFNPNFVNTFKNSCKIIYKNKILPLKNEFELIDNKKSKILKIKLLSSFEILNYDYIIKGCESFNVFFEIKKNKTFFKNYESNLLKYSYHEMSKLVYYIKEKDEDIKIFGKYFVELNRTQCLIIYNNKIFPLKEYFSYKEIEIQNRLLEIIYIELNFISDKSYMFHGCESLLEYSILEKKKLKIFKGK